MSERFNGVRYVCVEDEEQGDLEEVVFNAGVPG
jgi:hypothetical protein